MDTLLLDSDTSRWPRLRSSTRIQPTSSENITDDSDNEMKDITPIVTKAPAIDWEGSIQSGFDFSSTYKSTNGREYSNNGADASALSRDPKVDQKTKLLDVIHKDRQKT